MKNKLVQRRHGCFLVVFYTFFKLEMVLLRVATESATPQNSMLNANKLDSVRCWTYKELSCWRVTPVCERCLLHLFRANTTFASSLISTGWQRVQYKTVGVFTSYFKMHRTHYNRQCLEAKQCIIQAPIRERCKGFCATNCPGKKDENILVLWHDLLLIPVAVLPWKF